MAGGSFVRVLAALGLRADPATPARPAPVPTAPGTPASALDAGAPDTNDAGLAGLPEAEWRRRLTPAQFAVLRKQATERAHSSALNREQRAGVYHCAGCAAPLFGHDGKFDSGTGWPSFHTALAGALNTRTDHQMLQVRTEYHCARCGGHQGHVFNDGPAPSGLRYCNNGLALRFVPDPER